MTTGALRQNDAALLRALVTALETEQQRYREALEWIAAASMCPAPRPDDYGRRRDIHRHARAALEGKQGA